MDKHGEQYIGFDDDMPDDFNKWIQNIEIDDWLKYGDEFSKTQSKELLGALKAICSDDSQIVKFICEGVYRKGREIIAKAESEK